MNMVAARALASLLLPANHREVETGGGAAGGNSPQGA